MYSQIRRFSLFKAIIVIATCFLGSNAIAADRWKLAEEIDGIRVFTKQERGNPIKSFKGEMTIKSRLSPLVALMEDASAYPKWLYNCQSAKQIKSISDKESINYLVTKMPWPAKIRDSVVFSKLSQNPKTKQVHIRLSSQANQYPLQKGRVRVVNLTGQWVFTPDHKGNVGIIYEMNIDPAGNLPKWLVNAMSVDLPKNTLNRLREMIKKPKYSTAVSSIIVE